MDIDKSVVHILENTYICCKNAMIALAGVAQWIKRQPASQRVAGSFPSLEHRPGLQAQVPRACERQPHIDVSLSFSLRSPL